MNRQPTVGMRKTMIKDAVGQVKASSYALPDDNNKNHAYGKSVQRDKYGAASVMGNWEGPKLSKAKKSNVSKVQQNKMAIASGCVDAAAFRKFQKDPQRQYRPRGPVLSRGPQKAGIPLGKERNVFGKASEQSEAQMTHLIAGEYTSYGDGDDSIYPNMSGQQRKGKLPKPRPTVAAEKRAMAVRANLNPEQKQVFKMKKFKDVQSKLGS